MLSKCRFPCRLCRLTCRTGRRGPSEKIKSDLYEPDGADVFDAIVPEYLAGVVYGAMCESVASELAARRTAMEAATKNADEMIEQLNLYYNRARQASNHAGNHRNSGRCRC